MTIQRLFTTALVPSSKHPHCHEDAFHLHISGRWLKSHLKQGTDDMKQQKTNDKGMMIRDRRETVYLRKKGGKEIHGRDEHIERQSSTLTPVLSSSPENGEHHIEKMWIHNCLLASEFSVCPIGQTGASDDRNCFIRNHLILSLTHSLDKRAQLMGTVWCSDKDDTAKKLYVKVKIDG